MSVGSPTPASTPDPTAPRLRRARLSDAPRLIDLYLGLSEDGRKGFHPFPFHRASLWILYPTVLIAQRALRPFMRRVPWLIVVLDVAEVEATHELVGYATIRGVVHPNEPPKVRCGFMVREGYRGHRVGISLLRTLCEEAAQLGIHTAIGAVFRDDARAIKAIQGFGFSLKETDFMDPKVPGRPNYATSIDVDALLRTPPPLPKSSTPHTSDRDPRPTA